MADSSQTYSNHTRWHPSFHFFLIPVVVINVVWSIVLFYRNPGWNEGWWIVVSLALVVMAAHSRTNPLKTQDRIIRLEEQLRYRQLLPADLAQQTSMLTTGQIIALRFASDEELAALVRQTLEGKLTKPAEIKQAIKNWRGDMLRV